MFGAAGVAAAGAGASARATSTFENQLPTTNASVAFTLIIGRRPALRCCAVWPHCLAHADRRPAPRAETASPVLVQAPAFPPPRASLPAAPVMDRSGART